MTTKKRFLNYLPVCGMRRLFVLTVCAVCLYLPVSAQTPPFYDDIKHFKSLDSAAFPQQGAILFVGSSSFTMWRDVQDYFPGYPIINRGFGGSSLPDLIRYADEIIFPYKPKQILIYCGENDLAASDTVTAQLVLKRFKELFGIIRAKMPQVPIAFVSLKPSPSRRHLSPKMTEANSLVKQYLKSKKKTAFIDVYHSMFNKEGAVMSEIFLQDSLHMNEKGYAIWKEQLAPFLLK